MVLSAAADPDLDRDGLITRWLSKPFSPRQLRNDISAVLAQTATLATA
ncbi:hypothetical protein [Couchioplanes caeruleus]|nr:hypothetical protein [Couchioplanes caeruleus]